MENFQINLGQRITALRRQLGLRQMTASALIGGFFARAIAGMGITSGDHAITILCPNGRLAEGREGRVGGLETWVLCEKWDADLPSPAGLFGASGCSTARPA